MFTNEITNTMMEYFGEAMLSEAKKIDLIILDINELFTMTPSKVTLGGKTILDILGVNHLGEILTVDNYLLSAFIHMIVTTDIDSVDMDIKIETILFDLFDRYKIVSYYQPEEPSRSILVNYLKEIKKVVMGNLNEYITDCKTENDLTTTTDIFTIDRIYILEGVNSKLTHTSGSVFVMIKIYSDRKTYASF